MLVLWAETRKDGCGIESCLRLPVCDASAHVVRRRHKPQGGQAERQVRSEAQRALLTPCCLPVGAQLPCRVAAVFQAARGSLHDICEVGSADGAMTEHALWESRTLREGAATRITTLRR